MLGPQCLFLNGKRPRVQTFSHVILPAAFIQDRQAVQTCRHVRVLRPQRFLLDGERLRVETLGRLVLPVIAMQGRPTLQGLGDGRMLTSQHSLLEGERPLEETLRRSEEHTSELQSLAYLVCRLLLEKKKK